MKKHTSKEKNPGGLFLKLLSTILAVLCLYFAFRPARGIVSFEKSGNEGNTDIYTVTYSDGTTSEVRLRNGKDGKGIASIEKTGAEDGVDIYTVTYTDGSTTTLEMPSSTASSSEGIEKVAAKALFSSMKIYTSFPVTSTENGSTFRGRDLASGSAVIYRMDEDYTYIITNYHVTYNAKSDTDDHLFSEAYCYLYGSEGYPADAGRTDILGYPVYSYGEMAIACRYVGGSVASDLAVLRVSTDELLAVNPAATPIEFADSYTVGETVIAIGNTDGEGISVTRGVVSVDSEYVMMEIGTSVSQYRVLRTDTAIHFGNSGGPLFNAEGELVGITNGGSVSNQNVNYAIPVSLVHPVVENIMHYATAASPTPKKITLGVTVTADTSRAVYDPITERISIVENVKVVTVDGGSIAAKMGLSADDVLTEVIVNGEKRTLCRYFEIGDLLYSLREGDVLSFSYIRGGVAKTSSSYTVKSADLAPVP